MACCSSNGQKFWIVCSTVIALGLALILALLWPTVALRYMLYPQLELKNGSLNYENWKESPFPLDFEIFFFNWTNHEDVYNHSIKPHFTEMGPYVFTERHYRTNLTWNDNGTVTFYQKRIWHFNAEKSNGSLSDEVTNINVIAATVGYSSRYFNTALKWLIRIMMQEGRAPLVVTKNVSDLCFEGYTDPLLTLVRANGNPDIPKPPFEKFGWFVDRNSSYTYDGNFTMDTGINDITKLGLLQLWNGEPTANLFRGDCDKVHGTTGELLPPIPKGQKPPLTVFATDVCRAITIKYDSDYKLHGINGYKWIADDSVFDNGHKYPEMSCYCSAREESCPDLLPGVFNASSCKFGAPAFVSFPHFYLAHDAYTNIIDGMHPTKEEHEFSIAVEPSTGIPLNVKAQLQINILMQPFGWTPFGDIPQIMMPMFWFRQMAQLPPDLAAQARIAVLLPDIGVWFAYFLFAVGGLTVLLGIYCFVSRWRHETNDDDQLLR